MTGFDSCMRVVPIGPSPPGLRRLGSPSASDLRSNPAQNVPPAPVSTATHRSSLESRLANASRRASAVTQSTALRLLGRSIVTTRTGPSVATLTESMALHHKRLQQPKFAFTYVTPGLTDIQVHSCRGRLAALRLGVRMRLRVRNFRRIGRARRRARRRAGLLGLCGPAARLGECVRI